MQDAGGIAQLVEHVLCKYDVRSSNLLTSTNQAQAQAQAQAHVLQAPHGAHSTLSVLTVAVEPQPEHPVPSPSLPGVRIRAHAPPRVPGSFDNDIIVEQTNMTIFK